jgi:hypothetical protein
MGKIKNYKPAWLTLIFRIGSTMKFRGPFDKHRIKYFIGREPLEWTQSREKRQQILCFRLTIDRSWFEKLIYFAWGCRLWWSSFIWNTKTRSKRNQNPNFCSVWSTVRSLTFFSSQTSMILLCSITHTFAHSLTHTRFGLCAKRPDLIPRYSEVFTGFFKLVPEGSWQSIFRKSQKVKESNIFAGLTEGWRSFNLESDSVWRFSQRFDSNLYVVLPTW